MSNEVYAIWRDEMVELYHGALGDTEGVLDAKGVLKVPDGLWVIFGKINLDNMTHDYHKVEVRLRTPVDFDSNVVRLGPNEHNNVIGNDLAAVSCMVVHYFPGDRRERVNEIAIGTWNHYKLPSEVPAIRAGRLKIIAMRVNHFINEPYPG